jgi:amino acid transporter
MTMAVFSCIGGDLIVVAAGETRRPRRDLAPATRFMYLVPLFFYVLLAFVVGFNINYTDPGLLRPWWKYNRDISHSPFIIVLRSAHFSGLSTFTNVCLLISAYSVG